MRHYRIPLLVLLFLTFLALVFFSPALDRRGMDDFVVYWSASRLLATGANPYDPAALQTLQEETFPGREQMPGLAFASWNPPWLLLLLFPFGLLPFTFAARLMLLTNLGLIAVAVWCSWRWATWETSPTVGILIALALSMFFPGSLMTLAIGQISAVVMLCLLLGFWLLSQKHDVLAGMCFLFSTIKPQLVYFALFIVGIWVLRERRWRVAFGGVMGLTLALIAFTLFRPSWLSDYWGLVGGHVFTQYTTSTLGGVLHAWLGITLGRYAGILLVPLAPWIVSLADKHGWLTAMNVALLFSIPLAPYGFGFDLIVLMPALVQMVAWLWAHRLSLLRARLIVIGLAAFYGLSLWQLSLSGVPYHFFAWIPVWLGMLYAAAFPIPGRGLPLAEVQ